MCTCMRPRNRSAYFMLTSILQCGGHWVSLCVTNLTRQSVYVRITQRRGAFACALLLCRSNKCYIFVPINYRSRVREHVVASGVIPHCFVILFFFCRVRISNGAVSPYLGRLWSDGRRFRKRFDCCLKNFWGCDRGFVCMRPVVECHKTCVWEGQGSGARVVCCGVPTPGPLLSPRTAIIRRAGRRWNSIICCHLWIHVRLLGIFE